MTLKVGVHQLSSPVSLLASSQFCWTTSFVMVHSRGVLRSALVLLTVSFLCCSNALVASRPIVRMLHANKNVGTVKPSFAFRSQAKSAISLPMESIAQRTIAQSSVVAYRVAMAIKSWSPKQAILILAAGLIVAIQSRVTGQVQSLENGWTKRGAGGSIRRTVEVWGFATSYAFQYVSRCTKYEHSRQLHLF